MKRIFLTFLIAAFASAAWAQDTPKKPSFSGFVSNGFWDNWEISVGAGAGTAFSNGSNLKSLGDRIGFEGNFSLTKWVHPVVGLRAQLQGGWFNNYDPEMGKMDWPYMFVHTDLMLNVSNWIGGYREDRAWYAVPFVGFGYMASNFTDKSQRDNGGNTNQELAFTYGLLSKFRLSPAFDFNIELKGLLSKSELCPAQMNGQYLLGFSATAGLTYRFNQRGWQRGVPGYTAADIQAFQDAVAASMAASAALEAQNAQLAQQLADAEAAAAAADAAAKAAAAKAAAEGRCCRAEYEYAEPLFDRVLRLQHVETYVQGQDPPRTDGRRHQGRPERPGLYHRGPCRPADGYGRRQPPRRRQPGQERLRLPREVRRESQAADLRRQG